MTDFIKAHQHNFNFNRFISSVIHEDLGDGDHTSFACIPLSSRGKMHLLVKENGLIAGVEAASLILKKIDPSCKYL